jgi:hypothetical protein
MGLAVFREDARKEIVRMVLPPSLQALQTFASNPCPSLHDTDTVVSWVLFTLFNLNANDRITTMKPVKHGHPIRDKAQVSLSSEVSSFQGVIVNSFEKSIFVPVVASLFHRTIHSCWFF